MAQRTNNINKARWDKFCLEYVKDFDRVKAVKVAKYKCSNANSAHRVALRLLSKNVYCQEKIAKLLKGQEKRAEKTADDIIRELEKIAFSNIQDYIADENEIVDISKIDKAKAAAVESAQTTTRVTTNKRGDREYETKDMKFKLYNKLSALDALGKHLGIYDEYNKQKGDKTMVIVNFSNTKPEKRIVESRPFHPIQ